MVTDLLSYPEVLNDWPLLLGLFLLGIIAFLFSILAGGGGALLLVPVLNWLIGTHHTAPVLNLGTFIGRPSRLIIFWKHIHWKVCLYYAPAAILGAWLGGFLFSRSNISLLQILVGIFLISVIFQYRFGKKERSFPMRISYFAPLGIGVSVLSTLIGALGPVLNPFYLNYGLEKEDLIATKTANSFFMGISQIGSYAFFGLLEGRYWVYGLALGLGATLGNILGKKVLAQMSGSLFRKFLLAFMVISGVLLIYKSMN